MRERKNTVVLFSKLPEPGKVKTRLTTLKDGVFTPEQASVLYHCMLFDVAEIICVALNQLQLESDVLSRLDGVKELTLDFGKVEYISSAGLRVLIVFQKKMNAGKGRLTVCHVSDLLMDIFKATGLTDFIKVT